MQNTTQSISTYELISLIISVIAMIQPWGIKVWQILKQKRGEKRKFVCDTLDSMQGLIAFVNNTLKSIANTGLQKAQLILTSDETEALLQYENIVEAFDTKMGRAFPLRKYRTASMELLETVMAPFRDDKCFCETDIEKNSLMDVLKYAEPNYDRKKTLLQTVHTVNLLHMKLISEKWKMVCKISRSAKKT